MAVMRSRLLCILWVVAICGCQAQVEEAPTGDHAASGETELSDQTDILPTTSGETELSDQTEIQPAASGETEVSDQTEFQKLRAAMVRHQLGARDIDDQRVLKAMADVPRHEFVGADLKNLAYRDHPLPIGKGQTISQPYIVALMTQLAQPKPESKALDVGTGSGYQAAILSELVDKVYGIEIVESLADQARERLKRLGYDNVVVRAGDGYQGWEEHAPFDVIIVAAAPDHIPEPLIEQLAPGGRLVIPVGDFSQILTVVEKKEDGTIEKRAVAPVAFVPMTGEALGDRP